MCWIWLYYNHSPPISTKKGRACGLFLWRWADLCPQPDSDFWGQSSMVKRIPIWKSMVLR